MKKLTLLIVLSFHLCVKATTYYVSNSGMSYFIALYAWGRNIAEYFLYE